MKYGSLVFVLIIAAFGLTACSNEKTATPDGSMDFRCEEGETFSVKYSDDGKSVVLSMANENVELTLDSSDDGFIFRKEGMWLWTKAIGDSFVEIEDSDNHRNCHVQNAEE